MSLLEEMKDLKGYQLINILDDIKDAEQYSDSILGYLNMTAFTIQTVANLWNTFTGSPPSTSSLDKITNFLVNKTKSEIGFNSEKDIIRLWVNKTESMLDSLTKNAKTKPNDLALKDQIISELHGLIKVSNEDIEENLEAISRQILILVLKTFSQSEVDMKNIKEQLILNIENIRVQFKDYMIGWYKQLRLINNFISKGAIEDAIFVMTILSIYSYKFINRHDK